MMSEVHTKYRNGTGTAALLARGKALFAECFHIYWGRYLIDALFRNGKAHSNYGTHVIRMLSTIVKLIRLGIIVGGTMYDDIKELISAAPAESFEEYTGAGNTWVFTEFGGRRKWLGPALPDHLHQIHCRPTAAGFFLTLSVRRRSSIRTWDWTMRLLTRFSRCMMKRRFT